MSEVLQLKEHRHKLRQEKQRLALAADAALKAARATLATSAFTPLSEIDLETARRHMEEAIRCQNEMAQVVKQIHAIDRELGE